MSLEARFRFCFNCGRTTVQVRSRRIGDTARWFCTECGHTQVVTGLTERDDHGVCEVCPVGDKAEARP